MFQVGKQVVCLVGDNGIWPDQTGQIFYRGPNKGDILTVDDIKDYRPIKDCLGLKFYEFHEMTSVGPAYYDSRWFRPVKDTSIDCFTQLLTPIEMEI